MINQCPDRIRQEYVRLARESCLVNYYGDQMKSKDEMLKDIKERKLAHDKAFKEKYQKDSSVISFEQGKQLYQERLQTIERDQNKVERLSPNQDVLNSERINQKLEELRNENREEPLEPLFDHRMESEYETKDIEEVLPESVDILRMAGIEENRTWPVDEIENVQPEQEEYYNTTSSNFITGISNASDATDTYKKSGETKEDVKAFRFFVLRCMISFLILLSIIIMDQRKVTYKQYNVSKVYEKVISTQIADQLQRVINATTKK